MKLTRILILTLTMIFCIAGCRTAEVYLSTPTHSHSIPTTAKPTTVPTTTTVPATTNTTTPITTGPATVPQPTVPETCPPVEGDIYWGDFYGKGFKLPEMNPDGIQYIRLFSDGTCYYTTPPVSSFAPTIYTTWSFDGEYLYIGDVASGYYCTFRYVGALNPYESKLIYVKTEQRLDAFRTTPDGTEWIFDGIKKWE